jgi:hypothetical protein
MKRQGHDGTRFFIGTEVEHTPAYGHKTLFVVGLQSISDIEAVLTDPYTQIGQPVTHIYFGANQSFPNLPVNNGAEWGKWESMIYHFLDQDYWCTLDVDVTVVEGLCESGLPERNNFVPMISVKMPYIECLGYNATVKIDDKDFAATNPGVWCHSVHTLMSRRRFTHWKQYTKDEVIK